MAHNNQNKERYARAPYNFIPFPKKYFIDIQFYQNMKIKKVRV
ncbi:hypothetical protein CFSAN002368_11581 [Clostridium botulinum A1 str. CFSAN002368]|nr:hypothetical protein CFSAN002368_11581 [Clostridium botulinum A1 str. CFSAN002368]